MYTAFYGLREKPFALSPDPRFLYLAASHREALAHLLYGIEQGEGFISVTGEVGTGKTTLCRTLLERLEGDVELAFLFNPSKSAIELLQSICAEFGLPAEGLGRRNLMSQLNKFLLEQKERGRRVLLIIDEAQTLSENTLEQVRLLSNLETSRAKLIQILLLGQPELDRKLDERGLRQLRQRISVRWKLEPLSMDETIAYVRHRIAIAAGAPRDLFSESALRDVHRRTGGIPRLVNQLCDRALLAGYAARAAQIGPNLIRAAAREIPDVRDPSDLRSARDPRGARALLPTWMKRPWMYFAMTLVFVAGALVAGLAVGRSGLARSERDPLAPVAAGRPDSASASMQGSARPMAGASSASDAVVSDGSTSEISPYVGRLLGYVDGGEGESAAPLHASDAALLAAGLDPTRLANAAQPADAPVVSRSAVAPGALPYLLAERSSTDALAESERALFDLYDLAPSIARADTEYGRPTSADQLQRRLIDRGLMATAFDGGSLSMLRRLDHPVLIPVALVAANAPAVAVPESERRWLALTGFDGDRAWLAGLVAGRVVSVPLDDLAPRWLEAGVLVWKNHERLPTRLDHRADEASVRWLQSALADLGYSKSPITGRFDAATADALRDFQSENDIVEDGALGPLSQIALYARLTRYPVPRLSLASAAPSATIDGPSGTSSDAPTNTSGNTPGNTPGNPPTDTATTRATPNAASNAGVGERG